MTGNELLNTALDLCGLRKENGEAPSDTADLTQRALSLINTVIAENAELDSRIRKCEHRINTLSALDGDIAMSDIITHSVLPYSLARLLLLGEDDELAAGFHRLANDARERAIRFGKARVQAITEVYG